MSIISLFSFTTQLLKQTPTSLGRLCRPHRQPSNSWRPYGITVSIRLTTLTGFTVISELLSHFPAMIFPSLLLRVAGYSVIEFLFLDYFCSSPQIISILVRLWCKPFFFFALSSRRRRFVCSFLMTHLTNIIETMHLTGCIWCWPPQCNLFWSGS